MKLEFNKTGLVSELHNTKQKATAKEVIKANEFFEWFRILGGDLKEFNAENLILSCCESFNKISSFKSNPEATKQKFNHKFNYQ